jgi:4-hydroxybenzoate polyprenyltransferase
MSFAAINNNVPLLAWVLYAANIIWVLIYDTEYAMVDRDADVKLSIYSTALLFGLCLV